MPRIPFSPVIKWLFSDEKDLGIVPTEEEIINFVGYATAVAAVGYGAARGIARYAEVTAENLARGE